MIGKVFDEFGDEGPGGLRFADRNAMQPDDGFSLRVEMRQESETLPESG
jgi:hypothetical protein